MTRMQQQNYHHTCLRLAIAGMLLLVMGRQAEAACKQVDNRDLVEYACEGGSTEDLKDLPENVEKLRVDYMPIQRLGEEHFSRFPNLVVLTLSHCQIEEIDDNAFARQRGLQQLSLDNNRLSEVKSGPFRDLQALTYLDLNYNEIDKIDGDVFRHLRDLVDLRLSGNRLSCIDFDSMAQLRELKRVFISENPSFGCPNALKRFLSDRQIDFETDSSWNNIAEDRVNANIPPPPPPRDEHEEMMRRLAQQHHRQHHEMQPSPPPPSGSPRPEDEEHMFGSDEMGERGESSSEPRMDGGMSTISVTPPPPGRSRWYDSSTRRQPYVPSDTWQPSSPDQEFQYQGPYYAPGVTPQELDNYHRGASLEERARNATEHAWNRTASTAANVTGQLLHDVTTECPNSALLGKSSSSFVFYLTLLTLTTVFAKCFSSC